MSYDFRANRSRDGPEEMLASYRGYLQADGYAVYTSLANASAGRLVDVACWAHGRRGFDEALHTTSHLLVHEALVWIQQLYDLANGMLGMRVLIFGNTYSGQSHVLELAQIAEVVVNRNSGFTRPILSFG